MTEREKMARIIAEHLCQQGKRHAQTWGDERVCYSRNVLAECALVSDCVDALIDAGIRDITNKGHICMNGEVILPTPEIYNKVAELLDCPKLSEAKR